MSKPKLATPGVVTTRDVINNQRGVGEATDVPLNEEELTSALKDAAAEIGKLRALLEERDEQLENLEEKVIARDEKIYELGETVGELDVAVKVLEDKDTEREAAEALKADAEKDDGFETPEPPGKKGGK